MSNVSKALLTVLIAAIACGGEKGNQSDTAAKAPPATAAASAPATTTADGATVYQRCATCHQANGEGIPGTYPPLAGSEWVKASDPSAAIRVILHGLQGPVTIHGQTFSSAMPPFGTGVPMSDEEIAAVLTHERGSWGNAAPAVTAEMVARQRAATASQQAMWTADQLKSLVK